MQSARRTTTEILLNNGDDFWSVFQIHDFFLRRKNFTKDCTGKIGLIIMRTHDDIIMDRWTLEESPPATIFVVSARM